MNERTLKLFMQACRHADYEHQNVPKELVEKFAELIVRECMMLCGAVSGAAEVARPNDAFGESAEKCKDLIKEHFGVK